METEDVHELRFWQPNQPGYYPEQAIFQKDCDGVKSHNVL